MNKKILNKTEKNYSYYTIGHSNHSLEEFINILKKVNIDLVIDVRSLPGSKKYPQYNKENLCKTLELNQINYRHIPKLGGFRSNNISISPEVNGFWLNQSFHNYTDYAMSDNFKEGLDELIELGYQYQCVIMCAEVLWWRCHRRIITDYLLSRGNQVFHIINSNNIEKAFMNKGSKILKTKNIIYPKKS